MKRLTLLDKILDKMKKLLIDSCIFDLVKVLISTIIIFASAILFGYWFSQFVKVPEPELVVESDMDELDLKYPYYDEVDSKG